MQRCCDDSGVVRVVLVGGDEEVQGQEVSGGEVVGLVLQHDAKVGGQRGRTRRSKVFEVLCSCRDAGGVRGVPGDADVPESQEVTLGREVPVQQEVQASHDDGGEDQHEVEGGGRRSL